LCPDVFSTGLSGAERGRIRVGDSVAVFAQGPIGLCASLGAKLMGAALVIGIDTNDSRLAIVRRFGANHVINARHADPLDEIAHLTNGRGVTSLSMRSAFMRRLITR
jgi:threonine dehydrogenase-like Zn-dependent dehydrogenase